MNAIVTGAAGFLGSHLVDRLLAGGYRVVGIDNFITGARSNLRTAEQHAAFSFVEGDVADAAWLSKPEVNAAGTDIVFHFASPASPIDYAAYPLETLAVNSAGTQTCCELALRSNARLVYASTSEVYGDPLEHPQNEAYWGNVNPNGPRSCYDEGKRFGEALVTAYVRSRALDARIVRIFNTYGPRMRSGDGRAVPTFIAQALGNRALTIAGDGAQTRSLCYVDDLIEGIVRLSQLEDAAGIVVNLGSDEERTVAEIAAEICRLSGVPLRVERRPAAPDDPVRRRPDLSRARSLLDWQPRVSLAEGLRRTIAHFRASSAEPQRA